MDPTPPGPHLGYPDSVDSTPRSRNADCWDDPPPAASSPFSGSVSGKLRLMCSYGGHIVPRPHDKSLCYLAGETRIVVVDRRTSLADLSLRLSRTLLDGCSFALKYQLPNEDLDSLISVTTDEDLDNMIEEYDRTSTSLEPSRLRVFLFPTKPESASSMGSLLDDSKSETWFVDALNGAGILPRGLSADSNSVNCLLGLDDVPGGSGPDNESGHKALKQEIQSVPGSPMLDKASSCGSASSVPNGSNLPPIRVRVDGPIGLEEQFTQMMKMDGGFKEGGPMGNPQNSGSVVHHAVGMEISNRGLSEDERSDLGPTVRKPPQPPQKAISFDSADPDTVSRDNLGTTISRPKPAIYQDTAPPIPPRDRIPSPATAITSLPDPKREIPNPNYRIPVQVQEQNLVLPMQAEQQQPPQFMNTGPHYIHHNPTSHVPVSYYQMHHQMQQHLQQQQQQQVEQQYPMYFVPTRQNPPSIPPPKPTPLATPTMVPPPYKDTVPIYPTRHAPPPRPEMYRTAAGAAAAQGPFIHMPDPQHQYMGYHQVQSNFAYEYVDPAHGPVYYTQPPATTTLASQYQTLTSADASMSSQAGPMDIKQNRTSQPL